MNISATSVSIEDIQPTPAATIGGTFGSAFTMAEFDAIFQLSMDALQPILDANARRAGLDPQVAIPAYDATKLPPDVEDRLNELVASAFPDVRVQPIAVRITLSHPSLRTLRATLPNGTPDGFSSSDHFAEVSWNLSLGLVVERRPSYAGRPRSQSLVESELERATLDPNPSVEFPPQEALASHQAVLSVDSGTVLTYARVNPGMRALTVWAELEFIPGAVKVSSRVSLVSALLDAGYWTALNTLIETLVAADSIAITPHFAFPPPDLPHVPVGHAPPDPVVAAIAITTTSADQRDVLAVCANSPGPMRGDPKRVVPFLSKQNYSHCFSQEIVQWLVRYRWSGLDLPRGFEFEGPIEIPNNNSIIKARARVQFRLLPTQPKVSLVNSPFPLQDALRIVCDQEIQLLKLFDGDGNSIDIGGPLAEPAQTPLSWRVQLFDHDPGESGAAVTFLDGIGAILLEPLYTPMLENVQLRKIKGHTLSAKGIVFLQGELQ